MHIATFRLQLYINEGVWRYIQDTSASARDVRSHGGRAFVKLLFCLSELPEFDTRTSVPSERILKPKNIEVNNVGAIDGTDEIHEEFGTIIEDRSKLLNFERK